MDTTPDDTIKYADVDWMAVNFNEFTPIPTIMTDNFVGNEETDAQEMAMDDPAGKLQFQWKESIETQLYEFKTRYQCKTATLRTGRDRSSIYQSFEKNLSSQTSTQTFRRWPNPRAILDVEDIHVTYHAM